MPEPLSIATARERVLAAVTPLSHEDVAIAQALGRVLAAEVRAAGDVPPFRSSAMDGFAVVAGPAGRELTVIGESRAGHPAEGVLEPGSAIRISTGAVVPTGADAVLELELADDAGGRVTLSAEVERGRNIREPGGALRGGSVVLAAGTVLGPAELGLAVSAGHAGVPCARRPRVAVLVTGDELTAPGEPLGPGHIHDANLVSLAALVRRDGGEVVLEQQVADTPQASRAAIAAALDIADLVLLSGGVSVGPHDHVRPALAALGVEERFWRVALRPGGPLWFGVRDGVLVLGLPGNPVSAIVTYLLFARPALAALVGAPEASTITGVLGEPVARDPRRDLCLRVTLRDGCATLAGAQDSHVLRSLVLADALAVIPRGTGDLPAGTPVELVAL
ncbi:unannotated protein [freshwater metagenome]|uniref:molybdopterin molybdotransferase n=1 Tax=freshwater metagenome TaxID=449393 RepID=A0A6J7IX99_9ZZZZ|nr:molybdopterin molybdenumtransferase MoeA [Actinomycetota bacterium]